MEEILKEWINMPEYNNIKEPDPFIEAKFKFKNQEDYDEFHKLIKKYLYNDQKVFDGMQKKDKKYAWYPLKPKAKLYKYVGEGEPIFPVYVVSKGRWKRNPTTKALKEIGVNYKLIIEEQELQNYLQYFDQKNILILPTKYKDNYNKFWIDNDERTGPGPARNFAWDHSISEGYEWHWVLDDNIESFEIYNNNLKIKCFSGLYFKLMENFALRYTNLALCGPNYAIFCPASEGRPPYKINTRIYSCLLIRNDIPYRWRGRYNEDTDLSIRALKDKWCTVQFNAFLQGKRATQTLSGGNSAEFYDNEGTLNKSKMVADMHPDVCKLTKKFNRWHHHCNYKIFQSRLITKEDAVYDDTYKKLKLVKNESASTNY